VIVKPAEQTPLTALRVAELALAAGVPRGVFNVLPGDGPGCGEPLGLHPDVDMVSFTGSTETGRRFLRYAADSNLKKITLECGGKNLHARQWRTGDPLDPGNHLGALIDAEHLAKVSGWLGAGNAILGGTADGPYVAPTVFDGVAPADPLAREEIFGPILSVITVASVEEAVAVANDTDYGLAASVFSANGKQALRAARAIRAQG